MQASPVASLFTSIDSTLVSTLTDFAADNLKHGFDNPAVPVNSISSLETRNSPLVSALAPDRTRYSNLEKPSTSMLARVSRRCMTSVLKPDLKSCIPSSSLFRNDSPLLDLADADALTF